MATYGDPPYCRTCGSINHLTGNCFSCSGVNMAANMAVPAFPPPYDYITTLRGSGWENISVESSYEELKEHVGPISVQNFNALCDKLIQMEEFIERLLAKVEELESGQ